MDYDKLYKAAFEFKKNKIWNVIHESEIFAVKLSNNRIGYVTITGVANQVIMIAMYIGEEAVQSLLRLLFESSLFYSEYEQREIMITQNCIQCSFENKEYVDDDEAELIKKYAKKFKAKLSGNNSYPVLLKYEPYHVPWKITDENDANDLYEALSAALELYRLVERKGKESIGLKSVSSRTKKIIMLERIDDGFKVAKTDFPKRKPRAFLVPKCENEVAIESIKKFEQKLSFECEIVRELEPVIDDDAKDEAPCLPVVLFAVNAISNFLLPIEPVIHFEKDPDQLMNAFLTALIKYEIRPEKIVAVNNQTREFFKPFCEKLGIDVLFESEPSDFMVQVQEELLSEDDDSDDTDDIVDEIINGMLDFSQGGMSKDDFIDLLESTGMDIPKNIMDSINMIDYVNNSVIANKNKVIDLNSTRKKINKNNKTMTYVISVSVYKGCYRHIKISGDSTLEELHDAINYAFDFDDDHLHAFFMDNKIWSPVDSYVDRRNGEDDEDLSSDVTLDDLGLTAGKQFKYLFDFGDEWVFQCKVIKVLDERVDKTAIIKSVGESPDQYPDYDDEDDYDDFNPEIFPQ